MTESNKAVKVPVLTRIQNELKAPKSQFNSFGKYRYRNAEDIMQGVKPLLLKYGASLYIEEDIVSINDRTVIVETAMYADEDGEKHVKGHAPVSQHKGMSDEQAFGAAASYASKYALGKLFLLDDSQDADTMPPQRSTGYQRGQTPQQKQLHDQASAVMDEVADIKHKAETTIVDSSGTSLLDLCKQSKQEGGKGPAHQRIEAWIAENPELSISKHKFIKRIGELNIV
ncbi:ERF family protein [Lactobacillus delbrueckii subsp. bulgaricus]|nr:hypothetical protein [Lactobacillus delbrueckii subsp. bulgaricus]